MPAEAPLLFMCASPIDEKSDQQLAADFAAVFDKIKPAVIRKPTTMADRLQRFRKLILQQRRRGLSWEQISQGMALPPLSFAVSEKVLRVTFGAKAPAKPAVKKAKPEYREVIDPTTREVTARIDRAGYVEHVPNSGPSPMTAEEEPRFRPLLEGLIPAIVVTRMNRQNARSYAYGAVELWKGPEAERFQQVLAGELDRIDASNCGQWGLAPDKIAPFKRAWGAR